MSFSSSPRAAYMSRGEEIKIIISGLVLLLAVGVIFGPSFQEDEPKAPEVALPQPQVVDAVVALERFKGQLAVETGDPDPGQSAPVEAKAPYTPNLAVLSETVDFELNEVESPALYELMAQVDSMSDEELRKAPETHGSFRYGDLKTDQGRFQARGKFLTLKGRFMGPLSQWVLAEYPNKAGLGWVWQGLFRVGRQGYWVSLTDKTFEPKTGNYGTPIELTVALCMVLATTCGIARGIPISVS